MHGSFMYLERRILGRTVSHTVPGNNRFSSFIWMQSYQFGLQIHHEYVFVDVRKNRLEAALMIGAEENINKGTNKKIG